MGLFGKIASVFDKGTKERKENAQDIEDVLFEADLGGTLADSVTKELVKRAGEKKISDSAQMQDILLSVLSEHLEEYPLDEIKEPSVFLILGINGSGKTTTVAKLANFYKARGKKVVLAAADTFRAAAPEQLGIHAEKLGIRIVRKDDAGNPAAVIFDALSSFAAGKEDLLIADTAGRMHTRDNLIKEIQKIDKIVQTRAENVPYKKFLVLDATTGQNALAQAESFDKAMNIDALILTKLDSGSRGGAVLRICDSLKLPVAFVCNGENYEDIKVFKKEEFLKTFLQ